MNRSNKIWTVWLAFLAILVMAVTHVATAAEQVAAAAPAAEPAAAAEETPAAEPATDAEPTTDAEAPVAAPDTRALDEEIQSIKKDVVDLNRDLFVLEEELLFPANTQVAVFVSMDVGEFFALDTMSS
jgi:Na+-transporting methylmalonyl-CoA/oxaloacetate decarboxylase gamma subunit